MTMLRKSFATKLFLQATNARRTDTQRHRHSPGRIHTHLASLACVVSCWRLVAFLCRFARNLSARASSVSLLRVAAALWRAASLSLSCCGLYRDSLSRLRLHYYVFRQAKVYRALAVYVPYTKTKTIFSTLKPRLAEHPDTQTVSFFFPACSN